MADLLEVTDLHTQFFTRDGVVRAVDGVTFQVAAGETLGIVGESGCGKSVTALSLMRLIPQPPGKIVKGSIMFDGQDLAKLGEPEKRKLWGKRLAYVAQSAAASFNPAHRLIDQYSETPTWHGVMNGEEAKRNAVDLYRRLRLPNPETIGNRYPHQVSGGQLQRMLLARIFFLRPEVLVADEPPR